MDPKEYLPFLESMSALGESKRRAAIDTHLKRFDTAVACMAASGDLDEAIVRRLHNARLKLDVLFAGFGEANWQHVGSCSCLRCHYRFIQVKA